MLTQTQAGLDDNDRSDPPRLAPDELRSIKDVLSAQAESRKAMNANLLRVVVDGTELAVIDLKQNDAVRFDLDDTAEVLEVRVDDTSGCGVLATHLLTFEDLEKGIHDYTVKLEAGQEITFNLSPAIDSYGELESLACRVGYAETAWQRRLALFLHRKVVAAGQFFDGQNTVLKPALAFGLVLLAVAVAGLVFRGTFETRDDAGAGRAGGNYNHAVVAPAPSKPRKGETNDVETAANNAPPDLKQTDQARPTQVAGRPLRQPNDKKQRETVGQAPSNERYATNDRHQNLKDLTDENGILRLPIREKAPRYTDDGSNSRSPKTSGKSLAEIKQIYIETTGDAALGKQIGDQIADVIRSSGTFTVTADRESADAALKVYVRYESDGDLPQDVTVAVIARLVNVKGFVIYPNKKGVSGWKYVGTILKLPRRIGDDLVKTVRSQSLRPAVNKK